MAPTLLDFNQLAKNWRVLTTTGGVIMTAVTGIVVLFSGQNSAGVTTYKDFSDGSRGQSGSLLIHSGSTTLKADSILRRVGIRTASPETPLEVVGTSSGNVFHAQDHLRSSGSLAIDGVAYLNNYANCTALETVGGLVMCGTDGGGGNTYRADQGLTLTGTGFSLSSTISGSLLEFQTVSGSSLFARNSLNASGSFVLEGAATFNHSSFRLLDSGFANCSALETISGVLTCGTDAGGGAGLDQDGGDARYVNTAGDTMTGSLTVRPQLRVGSGYLLSTNGLVGHWKFDETSGTTATDSSTTANHGTLSGSTVPTRVLGKLHRAIRLNGTSAFVYVPDNAAYNLSSFTLGAWIRTTNGSGYARVVSQQDANYWGIGLYDGKMRFISSGDGLDITAGPALNDGDWHHIAVRRANSDTYTMYVDGRAVTSGNAANVTYNIAAIVSIGSYSGGGEYFVDNIDDVRVYNRALSPGEIRELAGTVSIEGALNVEGGATFNANTLVIDDAGGRVGIGTGNPGTALTLVKDSTISTSATDGVLNITAGTSFDSALGAAISLNGISTGAPGDLILYAGNGAGKVRFITTAEKMTILQSGNVGIGNVDPQTVLDVTGTFRATGNSTIGGTFTLNSGAFVSCTILTTDGSGNVTCSTADVAYAGEGNAQFTNDAGFITASSVAALTSKTGAISMWTNDSAYITAATSDNLTNKTGNISQWTNDSAYVTSASVTDFTNKTGNISQWTNNSGYITASSADALTNKTGAISQWTNDSGYITGIGIGMPVGSSTANRPLTVDGSGNLAQVVPFTDGTYTMGTCATTNGTITITNGIVTGVQECVD